MATDQRRLSEGMRNRDSGAGGFWGVYALLRARGTVAPWHLPTSQLTTKLRGDTQAARERVNNIGCKFAGGWGCCRE